MAIARRNEMPEKVTDVLVRRGEAPVLNTVARNQGARFSPVGFMTLATRAETDLDLNEAISVRRDVPTDVRAQVKQNVARGFEQERSAAGLDHSLDELVTDASPAAHFDGMDPAKAKLRREIEHLHRNGQLTGAMVLRLAEGRRARSTAYAVALLAGLETQIVGRCLFLGSPVTLAILASAVGLEKRTLWHLIQLRRAAAETPFEFTAAANEVFDRVPVPTAQRILRFLKVRLNTEGKPRTGAQAPG